MHKETLWYEIYSGRRINWSEFNKYFSKNGDDDTWYIYYIEEDLGPQFELHAHITGDIVVTAETFKADVYAGHGKPIIDEKNLTSSEKKYAIEIFDKCFMDRVGDELHTIIENAVSMQVEFGGYKSYKKGKDHVTFLSGDGKQVKLQNKKLIQAIDYSHLDLSVLRDEIATQELAKCLGIKNYEPLVAILRTINPTGYPEYSELERKYRYEKMKHEVQNGSIESCSVYMDVLKDSKNNIEPFCAIAIENNNEELLKWLILNTEKAQCDLCAIMGIAIKKDKEDLFYYLLNSGLYKAVDSDSTKWNSPMYVAVRTNGRERYVKPLLERGFSLSYKTAYSLYSTYSLEQLSELMPYAITLDQNTINRIYAEDRSNMIDLIEKRPLKYCDLDMLFTAYIEFGKFDKFIGLLENGYMNESPKLFAKAYENSKEWTDKWIEYGFDVNIKNAVLLHEACEDLKVDFAIYLLENGADPHLRESYSGTVFEKAGGFHGYLDEAKQKEKERLCKYLLDIGLNPIDESRRSPSILAYLLGKSEEFDLFMVDWLAEHGCINKPDLPPDSKGNEQLPISHILCNGYNSYNPKVLRKFIERGACLNAEGITSDKLFLESCRWCKLPELKLVVEAGANLNECEKNGTNALFVAVAMGRNLEIIRYLVELGIDINSVRKDNPWVKGIYVTEPDTSVLDVAERNCSEEVVSFLKEQGALHFTEIQN